MPGAGENGEHRMPRPDRRILDVFGIDLPIIQAPMAGITTPALISAVARETPATWNRFPRRISG
jgi:hypothetical protein